jgi:pimeloyl-ACP methyl ester carboxylesterase
MGNTRRRPSPAIGAALLGAAAIAAALFFKPFPALEDQALLRSDDAVRVERGPAGLFFAPSGKARPTGLVVYGAERVPPEAYAYLARAAAAAGYPAVLATMPLNFPAFARGRAARAAAAYPWVARWVIAGHSAGGSAAASYAAGDSGPGAAGLLLLAPRRGIGADLSTKSLPVVTVSASRDSLSPPAALASAARRLPAGARFVEISGGNHAQFGEYGPQPGDGLAELSGPAQRRAAVEEALALLGRVEAGAGK